jgi:hypothetical protein
MNPRQSLAKNNSPTFDDFARGAEDFCDGPGLGYAAAWSVRRIAIENFG